MIRFLTVGFVVASLAQAAYGDFMASAEIRLTSTMTGLTLVSHSGQSSNFARLVGATGTFSDFAIYDAPEAREEEPGSLALADTNGGFDGLGGQFEALATLQTTNADLPSGRARFTGIGHWDMRADVDSTLTGEITVTANFSISQAGGTASIKPQFFAYITSSIPASYTEYTPPELNEILYIGEAGSVSGGGTWTLPLSLPARAGALFGVHFFFQADVDRPGDVPEPSSLGMGGVSVLALFGARQRGRGIVA
jgi:hypothetical protein